MRIRKFELKTQGKQNIDVGGARPTVLSAAAQGSKLILWVQLEEDYPGSFNLDVLVVGEGIPYELQGDFAGTAVMPDGSVWHVFAKSNYIRADI
jgi:hypothetical protein